MGSSYFCGSRSAERNARITSSRLFSLISSSANRVGRSSCGASTALPAPANTFGAGARAGTGRTGPDGVSFGGDTDDRDAAGATRVVCGSGAPGMRRLAGLEVPGGAGSQGCGAFGATGFAAAGLAAAAGRACAAATGGAMTGGAAGLAVGCLGTAAFAARAAPAAGAVLATLTAAGPVWP